MQLAFEPKIPLAVWTPLALAAAALLVVYAVRSRQLLRGARRGMVLGLMSVALILPLAILLNPVWSQRLPPPAGKPLLTILVDNSASMATADAAQNQSRFAQAASIVGAVDSRLADKFDIEIKTFSATTRPVSSAELRKETPSGDVTDIAGSLESSLQDRPQGQAIWLLSDGVNNAGGGSPRLQIVAEKAKAAATPIYASTLGQQSGVKDLELTLQTSAELAFVDQDVPIRLALRQRGVLNDRTRLTVKIDDEIQETRDVALAPDAVREETLPLKQAKPGLYRYEFVTDALAGEVTDVNNHATLMLRVIDEPVKVALLEGKPYWDSKFLLRTLSADPSVELTSVVRIAPNRYLERKVSRPSTAESESAAADTGSESAEATAQDAAQSDIRTQQETWEIRNAAAPLLEDYDLLARYQVIVLGRDAEAFLTERGLINLKKWLAQEEGSLVCFRGVPAAQVNQRLGELLPVRWTAGREMRFRVQPTQSGQSLGWMASSGEESLSNLPSLSRMMQPAGVKPLAVVLATSAGDSPANTAEDQPDPVITFQPVGNGRVVVLEGAGMWRWAFLPVEFRQHDEAYGRLWRSLTRWLVSQVSLLPSQTMNLRSDKVTFGSNDVATGTLLVRASENNAPPPKVELTGASLGRTEVLTATSLGVEPGQLPVVFGKLPEGRYEARIAGADPRESGATTKFEVRGNYTERLDVAARGDLLKRVAQLSGGAMVSADRPEELAEKFAEHQATNMPERILRITAWDRWWVLLGVFGLWAAAWALRRSAGLI